MCARLIVESFWSKVYVVFIFLIPIFSLV